MELNIEGQDLVELGVDRYNQRLGIHDKGQENIEAMDEAEESRRINEVY